MWLLIVAIVLLFISAPLNSYCVRYLTMERSERSQIFWEHETSLEASGTVFFLAGIIMLFIAAGWKWGLAGLAIYWLLVVFVGLPIAHRVGTGRFPRLRG